MVISDYSQAHIKKACDKKKVSHRNWVTVEERNDLTERQTHTDLLEAKNVLRHT